MNFNLFDPRYISEIAFTENAINQERIALNASVAAPYELIADGKGLLKGGSIVFHRVSRAREPNAQFAYLEPQPDSGNTEAGTFHIDVPVDPEVFDRWLASGILEQRLSMTLSFGFTPPLGLKYSGGPDGWQRQTWSIETHRVLLVCDVVLIIQSFAFRPLGDSGATESVAS